MTFDAKGRMIDSKGRVITKDVVEIVKNTGRMLTDSKGGAVTDLIGRTTTQATNAIIDMSLDIFEKEGLQTLVKKRRISSISNT